MQPIKRPFNRNTMIPVTIVLATLLLLTGCATTRKQAQREQLDKITAGLQDNRQAIDPKELASLTDYLTVAYARNPSLQTAYHRWRAAIEGISEAQLLPNPNLSFSIFAEQIDTRHKVALTQAFPTIGVLRYRTRVADAQAQAAMHTFEAERLELLERVTRAVMEYHYLYQSITITAEYLRLLDELQQIIEARYRSADASYPDLIQIRIERERLEDRLAALRDDRLPRSETLAALLNLELTEPLPWIADTEGLLPLPDEVPFEDIIPLLTYLNPELQALQARIIAAGYDIKLARRRGWPQFMAGVEWMTMSGMGDGGDEDDFAFMAGVTLPIWRGGYRAARNAAQEEEKALIAQHKTLQNSLRAELAMLTARYQDATRRRNRFENSLIPQARQAKIVARQAYAEGRIPFAGLIDAYRMLLDLQLMSARAHADQVTILADIGCCIGDLDSLFEKNNPTEASPTSE